MNSIATIKAKLDQGYSIEQRRCDVILFKPDPASRLADGGHALSLFRVSSAFGPWAHERESYELAAMLADKLREACND